MNIAIICAGGNGERMKTKENKIFLKLNGKPLIYYTLKSFSEYEKIDITPYQVHKSKREHALAVFKLSKGIANILANNNGAGFDKVRNRLDQMAERFMTEREKEINRY